MTIPTDISSLIPQRPPFVMIDQLLEVNSDSSVASFAVKADNIFLSDGHFEAYGMIENIAQTAAAGMSVTRSLDSGLAPEGFLGAMSNAKVTVLPQVGDEIRTETRIIAEIGSLFKVLGNCFVNGQICFTCTLSLASRPIQKHQ